MAHNGLTRRQFVRRSVALGVGLTASAGSARAASSQHVTAFDIDGSLTRPETRDEYWRRKNDDSQIVGIVTARTDEMANEFIDKHDLEPQFLRTTAIKWPALNGLETEYQAVSYTYVGSWFKDWLAAVIADWQYIDGGDIEQ